MGPLKELRLQSTFLEIGMTQGQVVAKLSNPEETAATTCGTSTPSPYDCLTWTYYSDDNQHSLSLIFQMGHITEKNGTVGHEQWLLAAWKVL